MAVWTEKVFGTPREQAVGSTTTAKYRQREGFPEITKTTDYLFVPDQDGKPAGLHQYIGRRPVLCVGNSDGDQAMMDYTAISNPVPPSWVLFHHTGGEREYRYDTEP